MNESTFIQQFPCKVTQRYGETDEFILELNFIIFLTAF